MTQPITPKPIGMLLKEYASNKYFRHEEVLSQLQSPCSQLSITLFKAAKMGKCDYWFDYETNKEVPSYCPYEQIRDINRFLEKHHLKCLKVNLTLCPNSSSSTSEDSEEIKEETRADGNIRIISYLFSWY